MVLFSRTEATSIITALRGHGHPLPPPSADQHKHLGSWLGGTQRPPPAPPALLAALEQVAAHRLCPPAPVPAAEMPPKTFSPPPSAPQNPAVKASLREGSLKPAAPVSPREGFLLEKGFPRRRLVKSPRQEEVSPRSQKHRGLGWRSNAFPVCFQRPLG